ncbi:MAG TPA: hypothetical protein VHH32_12305, partial [Gemmatimonadales bacterium]|nr:hypothetical protein [Gemmatimonadales bacterium]
EGEQAAAVVNGIFTVISAWPEINHRLLRVYQDNELLLHAGPLLEYWDLVDEDSRLRIGGQGAVSLSIPFGARFAMSLTAYAAVIGSPFEESELPSTYELRTLWRRGFSGGIRYRL